ncbi:MAG: NAD(P)H-binding protein [Deltaproteobacteria bacterium]|nr:NAD(P)H-binding protein [Deltaproteobacteria bacterium]
MLPDNICRNESDRQYLPENVACIVGDIRNRDHLDQAVAGADVVICAFGPREPYKEVFCGDVTGNVIESMKKHDVDRLLLLFFSVRSCCCLLRYT